MWSLGITLIETVSCSLPYLDKKGNIVNNIVLLQNKILNLNTPLLIQKTFDSEYSKEIREFVQLCLNPLDKRLKCEELMKTNFYLQYKQVDSIKTTNRFLTRYYVNFDLLLEINLNSRKISKIKNNFLCWK